MTFRVWSNKEFNSSKEAVFFYKDTIKRDVADIFNTYAAIGLPMKIGSKDGIGFDWDKTTKLLKVTFFFTDKSSGIRVKNYLEGLGYFVDGCR